MRYIEVDFPNGDHFHLCEFSSHIPTVPDLLNGPQVIVMSSKNSSNKLFINIVKRSSRLEYPTGCFFMPKLKSA